MIAAPVQCDVDGIPKGSHYVSRNNRFDHSIARQYTPVRRQIGETGDRGKVLAGSTECHFTNPNRKSTTAQIEKKARGMDGSSRQHCAPPSTILAIPIENGYGNMSVMIP